jgi:hypothetical protein
VIFRRKAKNEETEGVEPTGAETEAVDETPTGPRDSGEVDLDSLAEDEWIDLGGLLVAGVPGMQLQLQLDEQTGEVQAALLVLEGSALELRAFAAPRTAGIWDDVRREIAGEAGKMGGTATDAEGPFGTELVLVVPVQGPDGQMFSQTSRVIGVDGPRWLLRGTILGEAAVEASAAKALEEAFRSVIIVRGNEPMPPREPIPLRLPPGAEPVEPGDPGTGAP